MANDPGARRRIVGLALLPAWSVFPLVVVAFAAGFQAHPALIYAPFALSLVLLGLPHGAVDHLVPDWLSGRGPTLRSVLGVVALYAVLGGGVVALWSVAPALAFVLFVGLTWFHWGAADLYTLGSLVGAEHVLRPVVRALTVLVRGGLPMLIPLLAFPETYRAVAAATVEHFGGDVAGFGWVFEGWFRLCAGALFALVVVLYLWVGFRAAGRGGRRGWWLDAGETTLLAAYFAAVPPILAVGLYFCLWHAARHVARLVLLDPASAAEAAGGRPLRAVGVFARAAAPLTAAALALLVGLYLVVPALDPGPAALLGLYLVLLSALTVPHALVVGYWDLREGTASSPVKDRLVGGR